MLLCINGHYSLQEKLVKLWTIARLHQIILKALQLEKELLIDYASKNEGKIEELHRQRSERK